MDIQSKLARRALGMKPSPIRKLVPMMRKPGMISLGGGYPNAGTFAFSAIDVSFKSGRHFTIQDNAMDLACQYGPTDGSADLKAILIDWQKKKDGVHLEGNQLQILNGSQEGLHIMAYLFLNREDRAIMTEPAYPGTLGAFRAFNQNFIPVPLDTQGMKTDALETILAGIQQAGERMPKFIYDVPNGNNPAGVTLSLERRRHLLDIASRYELLILEDDPYQLLQLDGAEPLPSLQSLDREGRVVRLDSFSKIFAPGLRLGYASGPAEIISLFQLYKQGTNLHTSSMDQSMLAGFFTGHPYAEFRALIRENCLVYRKNRDAVIEAARRLLPGDVRFNVPAAGMFIWFELPDGFDAERMVETDGEALGILLVPGSAFSTANGLKNFMRASFSMLSPDQADESMSRFAQMIERERTRIA